MNPTYGTGAELDEQSPASRVDNDLAPVSTGPSTDPATWRAERLQLVATLQKNDVKIKANLDYVEELRAYGDSIRRLIHLQDEQKPAGIHASVHRDGTTQLGPAGE